MRPHHWLISVTSSCATSDRLPPPTFWPPLTHTKPTTLWPAIFFFYSPQEINRRCTPMDQLFAMLVVLLLLYTGHLIYMKMQWLNRAVGVVMTLILLNKHRLSWSGTNKLQRAILWGWILQVEIRMQIWLSCRQKLKKKKKLQNKNDSPSLWVTCRHYSCWRKNRDKLAKSGFAHKWWIHRFCKFVQTQTFWLLGCT